VQRSNAPLVSAALLVLAVVLWSLSDILSLAIPNARLYILTLSLVPLIRATPNLDAIAIATLAEVTLLLAIALYPNQFTDKAAAGLLTVLAVQEGFAWMQPISGGP
jgi:Flp pilus assembly protein protease CpaA